MSLRDLSRILMLTFAAAAVVGPWVMVTACADDADDRSAVTVDRKSSADEGDLPSVSLRPAFAQLSFLRPVQVTHAGDGSNRLFVIEQPGRVVVFENRSDVEQFEVFLDIREQVFMGHNEEGLLSIAFHPNYEENGQFFIWYSAGDRTSRRTVLSRFTVSDDDPNKADPASEQVLLSVDQPWGNHNGATVKFGPDGYLYVSIGDGGAANDPHGHGQNLQTLLGSIIRIDVDRTSDNLPYAIPEDNPFVDREDARSELWAIGLRNVWRMSFDRTTGELWAGDVGQNAWEAVYIIQRGGNYGWNIREGSHPFHRRAEPAEGTEPLIDPVIEYSHRQGQSITGGYVYRGQANERLQGVYVYADYVSGRIWGLKMADGTVSASREMLSPSGRRTHITSFGEDEAGELYVCAFDQLDGRTSPGKVLRVVEY